MHQSSQSRHQTSEPIDPRIDAVLRHLIAVGAVLVLLVPAARESHAALGWLPLWLLAMPAVAWWALHRFALPGWPSTQIIPVRARRPRPVAQARRRQRPLRPVELPRAA